MEAQVGDRIVIAAEVAGGHERRGRVREVIPHPWGDSYRVAWDDGRESTIRPVGGTLHVLEPAARPKAGRTQHPARRRHPTTPATPA